MSDSDDLKQRAPHESRLPREAEEIDSTSVPTFTVGHERVIAANPEAALLLGAIEGQSVWDLFLPASHDTVRQQLRASRRRPSVTAAHLLSRTGETIDAQITLRCLTHNEVSISVQDMVPQKRLERELAAVREALRASEQRFHTLLEATQEGVALHDGNQIMQANDSFAGLFGYERIEEVIGKPPLDFLVPEAPEEAIRRARAANQKPYESSGLRQDGTIFPAEFQDKPITLDGQPACLEVVHDLTAIRQAEAEATGALARFMSVLENTTDCVYIVDREWRFRYLNERARRYLSQGRELLGQVTWEMFPDAVNTTFWREFHRAMAEQTPAVFEVYFPPQGTWYEVRAYPSIDGLIVFFRDVSERRESLAALRESETRFRTMAASVPEILFTTDSDGWCDYLSPRFHQFTGNTKSGLPGTELWGVLHPDDVARVRARWQECLQSGDPFAMECRLRGWGGLYRWFLARGTPMRDRYGQLTRWFGVCTDIEDQKHSEELLRDSELTIRLLLDHASQGIVAVDEQHRIAIFNETATKLFGYTRGEVLGQDIDILVPEALRAGHQQLRSEYLVQPRNRPMGEGRELLARRKDGTTFPVEISLSFSPASQGALTVAFIADVSIRRQTESLRQSNILLLRSNNELAEFASRVSHDLKEPLSTIRAYADYTLDRHGANLPAEVVRCLQVTQESTDRMKSLIIHLLENAHVMGGRKREPIRLELALSWALLNLDAMVNESGVTVQRAELPTVLADANQMGRLFQNLLSNSIKYRQPGVPLTVWISAEQAGDLWTLCFRDNGRGFSPDSADRIFQQYERLHPHETPGTGLGLASCRSIVEAHGGHIWAESTPGQGASFYFTLPAAEAAGQAAAAAG